MLKKIIYPLFLVSLLGNIYSANADYHSSAHHKASKGLGLSGTNLKLSKKNKIGTAEFTNNCNEEHEFEVKVMKKNHSKSTKDHVEYDRYHNIVLTPVKFKLKPGNKQVIKVQYSPTLEKSKEKNDYLLAVKQVPKAYQSHAKDHAKHDEHSKGSMEVKLVYELRTPIEVM